MRTTLRTVAHLAAVLACGAAMACSAHVDLSGPITGCPAAASARMSRGVTPGAPLTSMDGCEHRTAVEIPLAQVIDLNDNAQVLGLRTVAGGNELVVWSKAGIRVLPVPLGATGIIGIDLNNRGEVVACGLYPDNAGTDLSRRATGGALRQAAMASVCHVVVYSAQGVPADLGLIDPLAHEAQALAINDAGVITGTVLSASGQRAFVRTAAGQVTFIDTSGTRSAGVALNEQGEVAGWYTNGAAQSGPWHAFAWTQAGGRVDIAPLAVPGGAEASMMPSAINESGVVLGTLYAYHAATPGTPDRVSTFLWSRAGGTTDIGGTSGFSKVVTLNDEGEILGWSAPGGTTQPTSWAATRPSQLAVRFGWTPGEGSGMAYTINGWNEVLDSYVQGGVTHNVVWTWNPERYR